MRWLSRAVCVAVLAISLRATAATPLVALPETNGISVSYQPGLESIAHKLRATAQAALARIAADLADLPTPHAIRVHVVRDASDLAAIAPHGRTVPPWAIGIAYPDLGIAGVALRRGPHVVDPVATLKHELAHLALGAAVGDRAPRWLHEGFAYQHSAEWSWDRAETLAGMVWFGGVIELDDLDDSFPAEESPAHRAYAQSYDFVGYLSRRGRWDDVHDDGDRWPFRRFLTHLGNGVPVDAAAIKAFGKPVRALFEEWRDGLTNRYLTAPIGVLGLAVWILCALLLTLGWWRKRRLNKRRLAQWDRDERSQEVAEAEQRFDDHAEPPVTDSERVN